MPTQWVSCHVKGPDPHPLHRPSPTPHPLHHRNEIFTPPGDSSLEGHDQKVKGSVIIVILLLHTPGHASQLQRDIILRTQRWNPEAGRAADS